MLPKASRRKTFRQLYAEPKIYDAAFSWDPTVEMEFYSRLFDEYATLDPKSRLIEFAPGTGRILRMLSRKEFLLVGLDISPAMASFAKRKSTGNGVDFIVADMVSVPAKPESFGAALCTLSSINYLRPMSSISRHLREVSRVLTKDGVYIIDFVLGVPKETEEEWETISGGDHYSVRWSTRPILGGPGEFLEEISVSIEGNMALRYTSMTSLIGKDDFSATATGAGFHIEHWFKPFSRTPIRQVPEGRVITILTK